MSEEAVSKLCPDLNSWLARSKYCHTLRECQSSAIHLYPGSRSTQTALSAQPYWLHCNFLNIQHQTLTQLLRWDHKHLTGYNITRYLCTLDLQYHSAIYSLMISVSKLSITMKQAVHSWWMKENILPLFDCLLSCALLAYFLRCKHSSCLLDWFCSLLVPYILVTGFLVFLGS